MLQLADEPRVLQPRPKPMPTTYRLRVRWGTSRARDSYGYTTCNLYADGKRVASYNGGGYDMQGACFGDWIAKTFPDRLRKLKSAFYGLSFHDPNFNASTAEVPDTGQTVEEREEAGESLGLERFQAFAAASSKLPSKRHRVPMLDGACGLSCMTQVFQAIGGKLERIHGNRNEDIYVATLADRMPKQTGN